MKPKQILKPYISEYKLNNKLTGIIIWCATNLTRGRADICLTFDEMDELAREYRKLKKKIKLAGKD